MKRAQDVLLYVSHKFRKTNFHKAEKGCRLFDIHIYKITNALAIASDEIQPKGW